MFKLLNPWFLLALVVSYGAVFVSGMVYSAGSIEAAFAKVIVEKQDQQIQNEIQISKETRELVNEIIKDESDDLDVIRSAIGRLHDNAD